MLQARIQRSAATCPRGFAHVPRTVSRHAPVNARRSCVTRVMEITSEAEFEQEVLKADGPVLVDFWAPWCGPCKLVAPLMEWAEKEHNGALKVVKVEHGPNKELIERYKVYGLPALIVFKDGQEVEGSHKEGAITKALLQKYIKQYAVTSVAA